MPLWRAANLRYQESANLPDTPDRPWKTPGTSSLTPPGNRPPILVPGRDWRGWITTGERPCLDVNAVRLGVSVSFFTLRRP